MKRRLPPSVKARKSDERGFTLVELLVAIVILGGIAGAIASAFIVGLKTTDGTAARYRASHDAQLLSLYFPVDAQNATTSTLPAAGDTTCSGVAGGLIRMQWTSRTGTPYVAVYRLEGTDIRRYYCVNGAAPSSTLVTHDVVGTPTAVASPPQLSVTVCAASTSACTSATNQLSFVVSATQRFVPTPTTSTPSTSTPSTTTPPPSTTTTTAPCTYGSATLNPATVTKNNSDHLSSNVVVAVNTSGNCTAISVTFTPGGSGNTSPVSVALAAAGPGAWTTTVGKNTFSWSTGSKAFDVSSGATVLQAGATTLNVN